MARIGITEAAQQLGLSPDTIRRRIRKGQLTAIRDNRGMWQIDVPDDATAEPCIGRNNVAPPYAAPMQPDSAALDMLREQLQHERERADRAEARSDRIEARADQDRAAAAEREAWLRSRIEALTVRPLAWRDVLAWWRKGSG